MAEPAWSLINVEPALDRWIEIDDPDSPNLWSTNHSREILRQHRDAVLADLRFAKHGQGSTYPYGSSRRLAASRSASPRIRSVGPSATIRPPFMITDRGHNCSA